jgi:cellobiose phosphorylase
VLWVILAHALQGNGKRAHELFQMLNPLNHARTPEEMEHYKAEPYVVAADVYAHPQHLGRGGWTWYTGSAGWMYRIGVEHILGLQRRGDSFTLEPCIPPAWTRYEIVYRHAATRFDITVENSEGVSRGVRSIELDGQPLETLNVPMIDDGKVHKVHVTLGLKGEDSAA